jgi:hypothetical protein
MPLLPLQNLELVMRVLRTLGIAVFLLLCASPRSAQADPITTYTIAFELLHTNGEFCCGPDVFGLDGATVTLSIVINDSYNPLMQLSPGVTTYEGSLSGIEHFGATISGSGSVDGEHYANGVIEIRNGDPDTVSVNDWGIAFAGGGGLNTGPLGAIIFESLASTLPNGQVKPFAFTNEQAQWIAYRGAHVVYPGNVSGAAYHYTNIRGSATVANVPEPATGLLLIVGLAGAHIARKRKRAANPCSA